MKKYRIYMDGNQWCAVNDEFIDLQESISGFGNNPLMALKTLIKQESLSKAKITNKQFCTRLREAKKLAKQINNHQWTVLDACEKAGIMLGKIAIFDKGGLYENRSVDWVRHEATSENYIDELFNNSIRNLGEEP